MWVYQRKSTPDADIDDKVNKNHDEIVETGTENEGNEEEETK